MPIVKFSKVSDDEPYDIVQDVTIHDLFNELHRRIVAEAYEAELTKSKKLNDIYTNLDALHHDYTDLTS